VKVGSRQWEELMRQGYRVVNPRATARETKKTEIGFGKMMFMTAPLGSFVEQAWNEIKKGGRKIKRVSKRKIKRTNPVEGLTYTTFAAVKLMQERAREYGDNSMVKVFPESTASDVWARAQQAEGKMARVQAGVPRMALEVFGVVDRPRVYGYAPEKWVDEFSDAVRATDDRAQADRVAASEKEAKKLWGEFVDAYNRVAEKYMGKLTQVVYGYEQAVHQAIADLRTRRGVPVDHKQAVQQTGDRVLRVIDGIAVGAGALMSMGKWTVGLIQAITSAPEPVRFDDELTAYEYRGGGNRMPRQSRPAARKGGRR